MSGAFSWIRNFGDDLRLGLRQFRRAPGYAAFTVLALAVGLDPRSKLMGTQAITLQLLSALAGTLACFPGFGQGNRPLPARQGDTLLIFRLINSSHSHYYSEH